MSSTRRLWLTASRRRLQIFWLLGTALLAVSAVGAGMAWRSHGTAASGDEPFSGETAAGTPVVICFGYVDVPNRVYALAPAQPGQVVRVHACEGLEYKKGDILVEMDDYVATREVEKARLTWLGAEDLVRKAEASVKQHPLKVAEQEKAVEAAEHGYQAAEHAAARGKDLVQKGGANAEDAKALTEKAAALKAAHEIERIRLRELELSDPNIDAARARRGAGAGKALLEQAEHTLRKCHVTAPVDGTVLRVIANAGDVFGPHTQQPALFFCPTGPRIIRAEVEQEFADRVTLGQPATIQDDTTRTTTWRGTVTRISDWYTQRRFVLPEPIPMHDVRTLECIIELEPNKPMPRINQRVRVTLGR